MAHLRKRYIQNNFDKVVAHSPLLGIVGHRQVGKTTFLEKNAKTYFTLDSKSEFTEASLDPQNYLKNRAGTFVGIDECQLVPELFPALKEWVRTHKKPGQFLLSGSVRFTSREAIKESLTGRIMNLEISPLLLAEIEEQKLPSFCYDALSADSLDNFTHQREISISSSNRLSKLIEKYFLQGGLPGVCFIRDNNLRAGKFDDYLLTILDRDLRLVKKILLPFSDILKLVKTLSTQQGQPIDYSFLRSQTGISVPTIKKILYALEAVFILRFVPIEGSTSGSTFYFEDQGERVHLFGGIPDILSSLAHFAFTNVRPQFSYRLGERVQCFQYRTRGGALVPIAFKSPKGVLGVLPVRSATKIENIYGTANSFLGAYGNAKLLVVHPDSEKIKLLNSRTMSIPMSYLAI
jgi:predicted AAA+ superfamily ATPase